jgi:hypothetical protein
LIALIPLLSCFRPKKKSSKKEDLKNKDIDIGDEKRENAGTGGCNPRSLVFFFCCSFPLKYHYCSYE